MLAYPNLLGNKRLVVVVGPLYVASLIFVVQDETPSLGNFFLKVWSGKL
jgi:hypothetical protein